MYILLNIETWESEPFTDMGDLCRAISKDNRTIKKRLNKTGKCFIDQYFIQQKDLNKSKRGRK